MLTELDEGHVPLEHLTGGALKKMKVPELRAIITKLKIPDIKGNSTALAQAIETWYQGHYIGIDQIQLSSPKKIITNIDVRGLSHKVVGKSLNQKKKFLRDLMVKEIHLSKQKNVQKGGGNAIPVDKAVVDLLHLQNRTAEKVLHQICEMIMNFGLTAKDRDSKINDMNLFLQTEIFGTTDSKSDHEFIKLGVDGKIESIAMQNKECRKVFNRIEDFLNVVYTPDIRQLNTDNEENYHKLVSFATSYHSVLEKLWVYKSYNDDEINVMQVQIDEFMVTYKSIFGEDITNYFHYLDSGHVTFFLKKYKGNIMQFANQGWEGLNAWVKMIIKTKTQRGGACGKISLRMRKRNEEAVLNFCLRRLVWTFGYSDNELRKMITDNENQSVL